MLVEEAAKMPAKRWAIIAPNYEYGQSAVANFKQLLKTKRPDVESLLSVARARKSSRQPLRCRRSSRRGLTRCLNVTFGADLPRLVREGNLRGLFPRVLCGCVCFRAN